MSAPQWFAVVLVGAVLIGGVGFVAYHVLIDRAQAVANGIQMEGFTGKLPGAQLSPPQEEHVFVLKSRVDDVRVSVNETTATTHGNLVLVVEASEKGSSWREIGRDGPSASPVVALSHVDTGGAVRVRVMLADTAVGDTVYIGFLEVVPSG